MTGLPELLTVKETAERLRCHKETVYAMLERGDLAGFKIGSLWRIDAASLPAPTRATRAEVQTRARKPRQMTGAYMDAHRRVEADR